MDDSLRLLVAYWGVMYRLTTRSGVTQIHYHRGLRLTQNLASQLRSYDLQSRITQLESKARSPVSTRFSVVIDASVLCSSSLPNVKAWLEERAATVLIPKKTLEVLDQRKNGYLPLNMNARGAISYIEWVRSNNTRADLPNPGKLIIQHSDESTPWKTCQSHLVEQPSTEELNLINNATMKETEMGSKPAHTGCPGFVRPLIQCAIWRKSKEESRDWWMVTEDRLVGIWCKAYGIRCLSPAEVEQEYRQRLRERRARATGAETETATPASNQRGTSTEISAPGKTSSVPVAANGQEGPSKISMTTPSPSQSAPTTHTAAVAPPLAGGNNIWSDSNSGWNDNMALQSGFLQQEHPGGMGLGFPPMPPSHMMNHSYSAYGQFGPPQNFPVYPNMPGMDPFTGMDYSIGPWDPYDPYQNGNYNYGNQSNAYSNQGYPQHSGSNQPRSVADAGPPLSQGTNSLTGTPAQDSVPSFEEGIRTGASNAGHVTDTNDFSHFDSFDFLDEGDVVDNDDIKSVERQLKEVLRMGGQEDSNTEPTGEATEPTAASIPVSTPNKPPKQRRANTAPSKTSNNSNPTSGTPTRKSRGGEPRSANRNRANMETRGTPTSRGTPGKKRNAQRPIDPDFVKRGEGVLWTP